MFNGTVPYPPRTKMKTPMYGVNKKLAPIVQIWSRWQDVLGQYKWNGTRNEAVCDPDQNVTMWNRGEDGGPPVPQAYTIPDWMKAEIRRISPVGYWTVWDTELMHFKTTNVKNTLYFYDVLVWKSEHLYGQTYLERYDLLRDATGFDTEVPLEAPSISDKLYLAKNFQPSEWIDAWEAAKKIDWIEGLVLKRGGFVSRLQPGTQEYNNFEFMLRIRKPHKNYLF